MLLLICPSTGIPITSTISPNSHQCISLAYSWSTNSILIVFVPGQIESRHQCHNRNAATNQPPSTHYCNCTVHAFQVSATWIHEYSNAVGNKYEFKGNLYAFAKSDRKSDDRNSQIEDTIEGGYYHHQSITIYCRYRGQREEDALQITRR